MLWKCYTQYASTFGKLSSGWVFIPIPKKGNAKECSNSCTIALISHASKVMLKILQARLQQYMNMNFQMFKLDLEKAKRNQRSNCQYPLDHWKSKRVPEKHLLLLYLLHQSLWLCGLQQTVENSLRDGSTRLPYLSPEKPTCKSRNKQFQTWNNWLVQNWERSTPRLYIVTPFI